MYQLAEIFPSLRRNSENPQPETKSLKDDTRADLKKRAVWFNDLEFADYHDINGSSVLCLFDRYDAVIASFDSGRSSNSAASVTAGLQTDAYLLFIRSDEYNGAPRFGQELRVDGRKLYIQGAVLYDGVYEITLKAGSVR
ncbi:hypothetical protein FACS1894216_02550 [Synergistales bacterium]|nr:hypothetical protein FACS1894216_02550 [Synergistales bacterium]